MYSILVIQIRNNKLNKKVNGGVEKVRAKRGACRARRSRAGHWIIIPEESPLKDNNNNNNVVRRWMMQAERSKKLTLEK